MTRRRAPSRAARWPANVSALTLSSRPSRPRPMHAMTGTKPPPSSVVQQPHVGARRRDADAPRSTMRPSTVRCGGAASTARSAPSAPVRPTAATPAVVERRHEPRVDRAGQHRDDDVERRVVGDAQAVDLPLLDAGGLQRRVDFLAAAMHDRPAAPRRERAIARDRAGDRRSRAARRRIFEQSRRRTSRTSGSWPAHHSSPVRLVEAEHHVHVLHGLARAPFSRLSMTDTRIARPDGSTRQPMSQKFVCATCLISGSAAPDEPDERRARDTRAA